MTQEQKELLLKDLCARLPYGVKAYVKNWSKLDRKWYEGVYTVESIHPSLGDIYASTENSSVEVILGYADYVIKPYLFPLSSMTEEQKEDLYIVTNGKFNAGYKYIDNCKPRNWSEWGTTEYNWIRHYDIDLLYTWLNENHFDYRGLIPMGLAIDATGLNIY